MLINEDERLSETEASRSKIERRRHFLTGGVILHSRGVSGDWGKEITALSCRASGENSNRMDRMLKMGGKKGNLLMQDERSRH